MRKSVFFSTLLVATAFFATGAQAQAGFGMWGNLAGNQAMNNLGWNSLPRDTGERENASEVHTAPIPDISFNFSYSAKLRKQNMANFAQKMRASGDTQGAAAFERLASEIDIVDAVNRTMKRVGFSQNSVADAYATWWISAWQASVGDTSTASMQQFQSVKRQAMTAMQNTSGFAALSNAEKQTLSEAMLIQAALIEASMEDAAGDTSKQAALARAVTQGGKAMGLDFQKMTLTSNGFVPRSGGRSDAGDGSGDGSQLAATEEGGSNLALYAVAGTGLLAGVFALGKGLAKKG